MYVVLVCIAKQYAAGQKGSIPANIYLFKVVIEILEKGVKYVQS